jgi:hypothetical protein
MRSSTIKITLCILLVGAFAPTVALAKTTLCLEMKGAPDSQAEALVQ